MELVGGVDFVGMPTHDLEAAARFYGETLGLERLGLPARAELRGVRDRQPDDQRLRPRARWGSSTTSSRNALALHVDDVARRASELEGRGVVFAADTLDTGVCHMAFFSDPDGNALMLHHRYAPRAQDG